MHVEGTSLMHKSTYYHVFITSVMVSMTTSSIYCSRLFCVKDNHYRNYKDVLDNYSQRQTIIYKMEGTDKNEFFKLYDAK